MQIPINAPISTVIPADCQHFHPGGNSQDQIKSPGNEHILRYEKLIFCFQFIIRCVIGSFIIR